MPMPVSIEKTEIEDVLLITTGCAKDDRGFFSETFSEKMWAAQGFTQHFVQDNLSLSAKGTLRGLHYQIHPKGMGKLVRCIQGAVFDVAVDIRRGSPTFGKWVGRELNAENRFALWVPAGFAHGFIALEDNTLVYYKCTDHHHSPECERALNYNDPTVGIAWPMPPTLITDKDATAPMLDKAEYNFSYQIRRD